MITIAEKEVPARELAGAQADAKFEPKIEAAAKRAVLRLLNGPLCGCEYALPEGATLVIVGPSDKLMEQGGDFPEGTIVLPMEGGSNFEVLIDADAGDGFRLRTLHPQPQERAQDFQQICHVGPLDFAVRAADSEWEPGIVGAEASLAEVAATKPRRQSRLLAALAGFIVLAALLASGLLYWMHLQGERRVADAATVVAGNSGQYRLLKGHDDLVYLFAQNERDALWARQALAREGMAASVQVATLRMEEQRIDKLLRENCPSLVFHRLKLDDPARPLLILSQERTHLDQQTQKSLLGSLRSWMPYAQSIGMANWSDELIDNQARSGLDRFGIDYRRQSNADSVTYTIASGLSDVDLARLQEFTEAFYHDFGHRYVHFSVVLKDKQFKGKSFKYGGPEYFKLTRQHWFFPHTL